MYPADDILIARGKYSTLSRERRDQLKRLQAACSTVVTACSQVMRDAEKVPPEDTSPLDTIDRCLVNIKKGRDKLVEIGTQLSELKPLAWDGNDTE